MLPTNKSVSRKSGTKADSKVVCLNRISTNGLDYSEAGAYVELSINLSSVDIWNHWKMNNVWPRSASDCKLGYNSGSISSCDVAYDGGA